MRTLPLPMLPASGLPARFPPGCHICETFAAMVGLELGKALTLMARAFKGTCGCGLFVGAHGAEHPHQAPGVGCAGVRVGQEKTGRRRG